jgi:hypothetical protein
MRTSAFIALGADGFIAREDGALDRLEAERARVSPDEVGAIPEWPNAGMRAPDPAWRMRVF